MPFLTEILHGDRGLIPIKPRMYQDQLFSINLSTILSTINQSIKQKIK